MEGCLMRSYITFQRAPEKPVPQGRKGSATGSAGRIEPTRHIALISGGDGGESLGTELASKGHIVTYIPKRSDSPGTLTALGPDCAVLITDHHDNDIDLIRDAVAGGTNVVVVAREDNESFRKDALSAGCRNYVLSPVTADELYKIFGASAPSACSGATPDLTDEVDYEDGLLGGSSAMREVLKQVAKVAPTTASVVITGESGTGKEVVARILHRISPRRNQPFVAVNCGAIPTQLIESEFFGHARGSFTGAVKDHAGYFERAHGGTLFLDEVTEMPVELQVKLLRALETRRFCRLGSGQEQEVDIRIITATNRDPETAVEEGVLRQDFLYRIRVFPLHLPPLRDRMEDVEQFSQRFLEEYNLEEGVARQFSGKALDALLAYPWPGNLRELKNAVQRACIMAGQIIEVADLPAEVTRPSSGAPGPALGVQVGRSLAEVERDLILATLNHCQERRYRAARMLGVSEKTLYNRLRKYREESGDTRP